MSSTESLDPVSDSSSSDTAAGLSTRTLWAYALGALPGGVGLTATVLGFAAALLTGYFCLVFLVRLVKKGRLAWFAPYCFLVGLLAVILASLQSQP